MISPIEYEMAKRRNQLMQQSDLKERDRVGQGGAIGLANTGADRAYRGSLDSLRDYREMPRAIEPRMPDPGFIPSPGYNMAPAGALGGAARYLQDNPDVAKAGMDALAHFNTFGKNEGRQWFGEREPVAGLAADQQKAAQQKAAQDEITKQRMQAEMAKLFDPNYVNGFYSGN